MWRWIRRMRREPQHVRMRAAFLAAVVGTGLVAVVWVTTLPAKLKNVDVPEIQTAAIKDSSKLGDLKEFFNIFTGKNGGVIAPKPTPTSSKELDFSNIKPNAELEKERPALPTTTPATTTNEKKYILIEGQKPTSSTSTTTP